MVLIDALGREYSDDTPIDLLTILESNGIEDFFWIIRHYSPQLDNEVLIEMTLEIAQSVFHLYENVYPADVLMKEVLAAVCKRDCVSLYELIPKALATAETIGRYVKKLKSAPSALDDLNDALYYRAHLKAFRAAYVIIYIAAAVKEPELYYALIYLTDSIRWAIYSKNDDLSKTDSSEIEKIIKKYLTE